MSDKHSALSFSTFFRSAAWSVLYFRHCAQRGSGSVRRHETACAACVDLRAGGARLHVVRDLEHQRAVLVPILGAEARLRRYSGERSERNPRAEPACDAS